MCVHVYHGLDTCCDDSIKNVPTSSFTEWLVHSWPVLAGESMSLGVGLWFQSQAVFLVLSQFPACGLRCELLTWFFECHGCNCAYEDELLSSGTIWQNKDSLLSFSLRHGVLSRQLNEPVYAWEPDASTEGLC